MRNLFIIGMLLVGASMAGWFTIERDGENTGIKFDTSEIRSDIGKLRKKGRDYLDRREQERLAREGELSGGFNDADRPTIFTRDDRRYEEPSYNDRVYGRPVADDQYIDDRYNAYPPQGASSGDYPTRSYQDDWRNDDQAYNQAERYRDTGAYQSEQPRRPY